jgi:hypothetical protein
VEKEQNMIKYISNISSSLKKVIKVFFLTSSENFLDLCGSKLEVHTHSLCPELNEGQNSIVTINVSGNRFQTHLSTVELYPNTLLGNRHKRQHYWNSQENEYFFDRHRACFESILFYYQSNGRLQRPDSVPLETFLEEVSFFELGPQVYAEVRKNENIIEVTHIELPKTVWRKYIWLLSQCPEHSIITRIFYIISMLFTILSCVVLAIETLPYFVNKYHVRCNNLTNQSLSSSVSSNCPLLFDSPFFIIETVCVAYFTLEFVLRLISTPSYSRFVLSLYNWTDLAAIIPYFILLGIRLNDNQLNSNATAVITTLRIARVLRPFRALKLYFIFKQHKSMHAFKSIMKGSLVNIAVMFMTLTLFAFLFGSATFFVEYETNSTFDSIPLAIYWGMMTITTVG